MFYELLNQDEIKTIEKLELETGNDYRKLGNLLPISSLKNIIKDLLLIKEVLEEEKEGLVEAYKEQEQYYLDNYTPKPMSEYTGDLEDDRY